MNRAQVLWLLNYLSAAYRSFTIDPDEANGVVNVWLEILEDVPFEAAQNATKRLCRIKTDFAPTPGEIYQESLQKVEPSYYEALRLEEQENKLLLEAYDQTAVPMPDDILQKRQKLNERRRIDLNEH
ncbi:replicative helicase loader/inhibitor [Paenibacillus sp. NPDC058367]|uniref:replicative helicase loader/inhibitor n=1 Tax=Paenibacillus sp. NPDC058367 TaxID=3346460 RepID=UPI003649D62D